MVESLLHLTCWRCRAIAAVGDYKQRAMELATRRFGATIDGRPVMAYKMSNNNGVAVEVCEYGATITSIETPDARGRQGNVVLGFPNLLGYEHDTSYLGRTVGRYANRIANSSFTLAGRVHKLTPNNGAHSLHGGPGGFHQEVWFASPFEIDTQVGVAFSHQSLDGTEGFPGELAVLVTFALTDDNQLIIDYRATTNKPTVLNLTNHSYFNLSGDATRSVADHVVQIDADRYLPVDAEAIPVSGPLDVTDTPFDFRESTLLGDRLRDSHEQIATMGGIDHTFELNARGNVAIIAASVADVATGRRVNVRTTKPGVQFYTGNHLASPHHKQTGLCLETHFFPNSPNMPRFPTSTLHPGDTYEHRTIYEFSAV